MCQNGATDAKLLGAKYGADLVIWGELYQSCGSDMEACLNYIALDKFSDKIEKKGKTNIEKINSLSDIRKGQLQKDVDQVIYWTLFFDSTLNQECERAESYLDRLKTTDSIKKYSLYQQLAHCYYATDNLKIAMDYFSKAINTNKGIDWDFNSRGWVKRDLRDLKGAIEDLNTAIEMDGSNGNHYAKLGTLYHEYKDYARAMDNYDKAIELGADSFVTRSGRGHVHTLFENYRKAIDDLDIAIKKDSKSAHPYYWRALARFELGKFGGTVKDCSFIIENNHSLKYMSYELRGKAYFQMHEYKKAITDYDQILKIDSCNAELFWRRGASWLTSNNLKKSLADVNRAIELDPDFANAYYTRGKIAHLNGKLKKAINNYEVALALDVTLDLARNQLDTIRKEIYDKE